MSSTIRKAEHPARCDGCASRDDRIAELLRLIEEKDRRIAALEGGASAVAVGGAGKRRKAESGAAGEKAEPQQQPSEIRAERKTCPAADGLVPTMAAGAGAPSQPSSSQRADDAAPAEPSPFAAGIDVFLLHGLQFLPIDELFSSAFAVGRSWNVRSVGELNDRCRRLHPGLVASLASSGDMVTYRRYRRFRMGFEESIESGALWTDFSAEGIDAILEVSRGDEVLWHGVSPLALADDGPACSSACEFRVPHETFRAPVPVPDDRFSVEDERFPGLRDYFFWCGRNDCSTQQKALCKVLYNDSCRRGKRCFVGPALTPLCVHVVLRRRLTGQMVTVLSESTPNQIVGEDYDDPVGMYTVNYSSESKFDEETFNGEQYDRSCGSEIRFILWSADEVEDGASHVDFSTLPFPTSPRKEEHEHVSNDNVNINFSMWISDFGGADDPPLGEAIIGHIRKNWRWG